MTCQLRLLFPSGSVQTLTFPSRFLRLLCVIGLHGQAVVILGSEGV